MQFRTLKANEIEVRVARATAKGSQLLLYKDARCDMNILDETVGAENWQRKHDEHNGNLFCSVGIFISPSWIWKEDAGAESKSDAEKGHASDSFKRACVNWGIGRELYTAPFIWVQGYTEEKQGKPVCKMSFSVKEIEYDNNRQISKLVIADKDKKVVYTYGSSALPSAPTVKQDYTPPRFICDCCGKQLTTYTDKNGKEVSLRKHAMGSQKKFGKLLCLTCIEEMSRDEA